MSPASRSARGRRVGVALLLGMLAVLAVPTPSPASDSPHSFLANPDPADWTPQIQDGQVNAILQLGTKVVVGGTFTTVRRAGTSQDLPRNYLFAFDMGTGVIDPDFAPQLNGAVLSLAPGPDGASVFVGGEFGTVNGVTYRHLVRLGLSDGQPLSTFKANTNSRVQDLELNHGWLYVSGKFSQVKSVARSGLARVDPGTGDVDPNLDLPFTDPAQGSLGVQEIDVSPDGAKLVAIGAFGKVAGQDRVQVAVLDVGTTPATLSSWQTSDYPIYAPGTTTAWCSPAFRNTYTRSVKISPDGTYFVVGTTGAWRAHRLCDTVARWELNATGPGQHPTWVNWSGGDTTWSVAATGAAIYVGGHFRWWNNPYQSNNAGPGAVAREGIAALDPLTGLPFSWNPGHERGVGSFALPATPDGLWAGSDTDHTGGEFHQKIAFYPAQGGVAPPPIVTYPLPGTLYNLDQATGALNARSYDLSTFGPTTTVGGINWQTARGAFTLNGKLYYGLSDGWLYVRTFDGTSFGAQSQVNLNGLQVQPPSGFTIPGTTTRVPAFTTDIAAMTGMFYDNGRIYYTVSKSGATQTTNNNKLYYRYFNPENDLVGANLFVAGSYPADGAVPWGNVRGMTLASGKLIYSLTDGRLYSIDWNGTRPTGSPTQISGATTWQSRGMFAFTPPAPDTAPPTTPGTPTGQSPTAGKIDLGWSASTDESSPVTYRIYRDGDPTPVGQTTATSFSDVGLTAGSTHTYTVDAVDPASNVSGMSPASDPVTVASVVFADDFTAGDLTRWSSASQLTIDATQGAPTEPSVRGAPSAEAAFASRDFDLTYGSACASVKVNAASLGADAVDLVRLRTATGGPIAKVFATDAGTLYVRSDFAASQQSAGVALGSGWHDIELCGTVGPAGTWDLYLDGVKVLDAWTADTGTDPIGRIQLGDAAAKTWTVNFDHVRVDFEPGEQAAPDVAPPTTPGAPAGHSPSPGTIDLSWPRSFDDSPPITYRIYRDGDPTPVGETTATSFSDVGLTQGSTHSYTVEAVDAAGNASATSPASGPILVSSEAIFADDFAAGDLTAWTSVTRIAVDATQGSAAAPSARGDPTGQSAFASKDLAAGYGSACLSVNLNATSVGGSTDLLRLRTATGGPIAKAYVNAAGVLTVRSDVAASQQSSGVALGTGWHNLELCGAVGPAGAWDLYLDGVRIVDGWVADTGTQPIGRIQLGDTAAKSWTINFDDVRLDQTPG
jgi:fibronectin type 3 domain-containing protein